MEIETGIPVSMTAYMPDSCDLPNSQWKFMKAFCIPMFQAWSDFIQMPECFDNVRDNYEHWRKMDWSVPREKSSMDKLFPRTTTVVTRPNTSVAQDTAFNNHKFMRSLSVAFGNRLSPTVRQSELDDEPRE